GKTYVASYTSNYTGALRLFENLTALERGDAARYRKARQQLIEWIAAYPLRTNKWGPFFEDVPTSTWSDTEINADTMALYLMEHPGTGADGLTRARAILQWSSAAFANKEFGRWGVVPINEQTVYMVPGNSHTARHASVELFGCEKTGDWTTKDAAI